MGINRLSCAVMVGLLAAAWPAAAGTLKVTSFPSGAQVSVDGVDTGKVTPMNIALTDGDHTVTVQIPLSGWSPDTRVVSIAPGNNDLSVTLLPVLTQGPRGEKGDKGDKGDRGDKGDKGDPGAPAAVIAGQGVVGVVNGNSTLLSLDTMFTDARYARLAGGNTFSGNQFVNGSVSATGFSGDGSGLTNLNIDLSGNPIVAALLNRIQALENQLNPPLGSGDHLWSWGFANANGDAVTLDPAGNIVVTGSFAGTVNLGGGSLSSGHITNLDIFVAKYTPNGSHLWSKRFGGAGLDSAGHVATDAAGNVFVTGSFEDTVNFGGGSLNSAGFRDAFVLKLAADGSHVWSKDFGSDQIDQGFGIASYADGRVIVTGSFHETVNFGGASLTADGNGDLFVAAFDATGAHLWSKRAGGNFDDLGAAVAIDGNGDILLTGSGFGSADFGGGPLQGMGAVFIVKLASDGSHIWSQRVGSAGSDGGLAIAADPSGNVLVAGYFSETADFGGGPLTSAGATDAFVAKYGSDGSFRWAKRFGGLDFDNARVVTDGAGNVLVTGRFAGTTDFGGGPVTSSRPELGWTDAFIAKYSPAGGLHWVKVFGDDDGDDLGSGIVADAAGNPILTGSFGDVIDLGGGPIGTNNAGSMLLVKFTP